MEYFDVILIGLTDERTRRETLAQLQTLFRMDEQMAVMMLATAPTTVKRDVAPDEAEKYFYALASIGLKVELRRKQIIGATVVGHADPAKTGAPTTGPVAGAQAATTGAASGGAAPLTAPGLGLATAAPIVVSDAPPPASFWASLWGSFALPLRGAGIKWLVASTMAALVLGLVLVFGGAAALAVPEQANALIVVPIVYLTLLGSIATGVLYNYARVCMWGVLAGDEEPGSAGEIGPSFVTNDVFKTGFVLFAYHAFFELLGGVWAWQITSTGANLSNLIATPFVFALMFLNLFYWPMGVGLSILDNSPFGYLALGKAARIFMSAPFEYIAMTILTNIIWIGPWVFMAILAAVAGPWGGFAGAVVLCPVLAYSQALQGTLTGHIFRTRAHLLERAD